MPIICCDRLFPLQARLNRLCCGLFAAVFAGIFFCAMLRGHLAPLLWLPAAGLGLLYVGLSRLAGRAALRSPRLCSGLLAAGLALMLALMLCCGRQLLNDNWNAPFDTEALYRTALQLAQGQRPEYNDYFVCNGGNFFSMLVLFWWYRLVLALGGRALPVWGMLCNGLLLWLAPVFVCLAARELWGRRGALTALGLCFCFLPYYLFVPFLYTDPMAAPLTALCLWLALRLWRRWAGLSRWRQLAAFGLLGLCLGAAFCMKGNAALLLIALPLWVLLARPRRRAAALHMLACSAALLVCFGAVALGLRAYEQQLLDFSAYDTLHMPLSHWVMMGLENDGAFHEGSFAYSGAFPTLQAKQQAIAQRLSANVTRLLTQPAALLWLMATKAETCWLDGLYSAPAMAGMALVEQTPLAEWLLAGGRHFGAVQCFGQAFYLMLWGGALWAALRGLRRGAFCALLPMLSLLGNFCFFCLWEANQRYSFGFSCFLLLLFLFGLLGEPTQSPHSAPTPIQHQPEEEDDTLGQQKHS